MLKQTVLILICFLQTILVQSQDTCNFFIVDSSTEQGVPFSAVSIFNNNDSQGKYSDKNGRLTLECFTKFDSITFSCLGFYSRVFYTKNIPDTIKLQSRSYEIPEVRVKPNSQAKYVTIGHIKNRKESTLSSYSGFEMVSLIANPLGKETTISSVLYKLKIWDRFTFALRVHLYSVGSDGMPCDELMHENVIMYIKSKKKEVVEQDISHLSIKLPVNGIYVGLEWLGLINENTNSIEVIDKERVSIVLVSSNMEAKMYFRDVKRGTPWDNSQVKHLLTKKNSSPPVAAFGLKVKVDNDDL